jgi:hypothetical protein
MQDKQYQKSKEEWNIMKKIKEKIETKNLIITKADKGKTTVILEQQKYKQYMNS